MDGGIAPATVVAQTLIMGMGEDDHFTIIICTMAMEADWLLHADLYHSDLYSEAVHTYIR